MDWSIERAAHRVKLFREVGHGFFHFLDVLPQAVLFACTQVTVGHCIRDLHQKCLRFNRHTLACRGDPCHNCLVGLSKVLCSERDHDGLHPIECTSHHSSMVLVMLSDRSPDAHVKALEVCSTDWTAQGAQLGRHVACM